MIELIALTALGFGMLAFAGVVGIIFGFAICAMEG